VWPRGSAAFKFRISLRTTPHVVSRRSRHLRAVTHTRYDAVELIGAFPYAGSGKSLAYLLPLLSAVENIPTHRQLRGLVLVPTRELAVQVHGVALGITKPGKHRDAEGTVVRRFVGRPNSHTFESIAHDAPHIAIGTPNVRAAPGGARVCECVCVCVRVRVRVPVCMCA
jgi:hypothetical protein